jgi:hypothetical protein
MLVVNSVYVVIVRIWNVHVVLSVFMELTLGLLCAVGGGGEWLEFGG